MAMGCHVLLATPKHIALITGRCHTHSTSMPYQLLKSSGLVAHHPSTTASSLSISMRLILISWKQIMSGRSTEQQQRRMHSKAAKSGQGHLGAPHS